jgi:hypothetical protein
MALNAAPAVGYGRGVTIFDVTAADIAALGDADLRHLIAELCRAELAVAGLPTSAVMAGGDQRAPDGGIDVRVDLPAEAASLNFIPRPRCGFQVKQQTRFGNADVRKEMAPRDVLRLSIKVLSDVGGAYVIINGKRRLTDSTFQQICSAMRSVAIAHGALALQTCFYGGDRIADWVNLHPGPALWLRERVGRPVAGWLPFRNWSEPGRHAGDVFIRDRGIRIRTGFGPTAKATSLASGIDTIRQHLSKEQSVVRLLGLSGTGKTRLAQALFDAGVGSNPLPPSLVVYGDTRKTLDPSPEHLLSRLCAGRTRAILIVDDCPAELHRVLQATVDTHGGRVSLLTIEHDIREDRPQGTEVFMLEPASDEAIESLLMARCPALVGPARQRVVELAGGNARFALLLAAEAKKLGTLASLSDRVFVERLFATHHGSDDALRRSASVCALVNDVDVDGTKGELVELNLLGQLAEQPSQTLRRNLAQLRRRGLVQARRTLWSLHPQALALYLAKVTLDELSLDDLFRTFGQDAPQRLQRAFTRQIGLLHDSQRARGIARRWLSEGGLLCGAIDAGDEHRIGMLIDIAPLDPEGTLSTIERSIEAVVPGMVDGAGSRVGPDLLTLLRRLAFERSLFRRAALLMARLAATGDDGTDRSSFRAAFAEMFQLYLSGTQAGPHDRAAIIRGVIMTSTPAMRALGLEALGNMLEASHYSLSSDVSFGARLRDYGYWPSSPDEVREWYRVAFALVRELRAAAPELREQIEHAVASRLPGLLADHPDLESEVTELCREIAAAGFWPAGWHAVHKFFALHGCDIEPERQARLEALIAALEPKNLVDRVRGYVRVEQWGYLAIPGVSRNAKLDWKERHERLSAHVAAFGQEAVRAACSDDVLSHVVRRDAGFASTFGAGFAMGATDLAAAWGRLLSAFRHADPVDRSAIALGGYLSAAREKDPQWVIATLDSMVGEPDLADVVPQLQSMVPSDANRMSRLMAAARSERVPVDRFIPLSYVSREALSDDELADLLGVLLQRQGGHVAAIRMLGARLTLRQDGSLSPALRERACGILLGLAFDDEEQGLDYQLGRITTAALDNRRCGVARQLCTRIAATRDSGIRFIYGFDELLSAVFRRCCAECLTAFLEETPSGAGILVDRFLGSGHSPVLDVPEGELRAWAEANPTLRFPLLAQVLPLFRVDSRMTALGFEPRTIDLLAHAPDRPAFLRGLEWSIAPRAVWFDDRLGEIERRRSLLREWTRTDDSVVASWIAEAERILDDERRDWSERLTEDQNEDEYE